MAKDNTPGVSVVICAYTEKRWEQTRAALESALGQDPPPEEVLLVVDHNADLAARARRELPVSVRPGKRLAPPGCPERVTPG